MLDRVPTKPNRYAVYDENHNFIRYEYHERADEPTQVGDALNKANLLPDDVATALGLTGNPQVKDALEKIKTLIDDNTTLANSKAKIVTVTYGGTDTFGAASPNSLTFDFAPSIVWMFGFGRKSDNSMMSTNMSSVCAPVVDMSTIGTSYTRYRGLSNGDSGESYAKKSADGKTLTWYNTSSANKQFNDMTFNFFALAIG